MIWLRILGIDFAVPWATMAFLLNFIPFVGAILTMIPAVLLALVQADLMTTLLVALGYVAANTAIGSILASRIMGPRARHLDHSGVPLTAVLGLCAGTVGVFLAVPLTMDLIVALESSPQTRPLAILLGSEVTADPAPLKKRNTNYEWAALDRKFLQGNLSHVYR